MGSWISWGFCWRRVWTSICSLLLTSLSWGLSNPLRTEVSLRSPRASYFSILAFNYLLVQTETSSSGPLNFFHNCSDINVTAINQNQTEHLQTDTAARGAVTAVTQGICTGSQCQATKAIIPLEMVSNSVSGVFFPIYFWMIPWECSILLSWGRFITLQIKVGNITTKSLFKKLCQRRLNPRSPEARLSISVASKRECLKLPGQKTTTRNLAHINLAQECLHSYLPIDVKFWGHTCVRGNHSWSKTRQLAGQRITCNELLPGKIMCLPVHKFTYFNNI